MTDQKIIDEDTPIGKTGDMSNEEAVKKAVKQMTLVDGQSISLMIKQIDGIANVKVEVLPEDQQPTILTQLTNMIISIVNIYGDATPVPKSHICAVISHIVTSIAQEEIKTKTGNGLKRKEESETEETTN